MNDDDDDDDDANLFDVRYLGGRLDNVYNDEENPRPPAVPDYIIPDGVNIRLIIDVSVTRIDYHACYDCTTLIEVVFHNNVTEIVRQAFAGCSNLQPIELPAGLLRVGDHAFFGCTSLRGIVIPACIQYMGNAVFYGCRSLESAVFVPTTNVLVVQLGNQMFERCSNLRFVTLPQNLQSIPAWFFWECTSLTHLQIPVSVEEIEARAFCGSGLRSVTIPENVHHIRWAAFRDCSSLEKVTFHSSTNLSMDNDIFANCSSLSVIKMYPWLWPTVFVSMNGHPEFIFKFFRHYHTKILDFETPDVRLVRRLRRDRKRTATMMIDDTI